MLKKFFIAISIFGICNLANAETLEQQKANFDAQAERAKQAAEILQLKINSVSEVKRGLDEAASAAILDYNQKQAALDKTLAEISDAEKKLAALQAEYSERKTVFERRVRDIFINGQISYVDVIFGAKDFADFLTRMDLLKRVIVQDSELVTSLLNYQTQVQNLTADLEVQRQSQERLALQAEQAKNLKLEKVAAQQEIIDKMQNDLEVYNQQYDEMMASSQEVQRLIEESQFRVTTTQGYVSDSGKMIFPVTGEITSEFGWRTHPIFGNQRYHSGIDIAAEAGTEILAAQSGVVITAGWIGGYGNTVMIDHGGGIVSLYGHNQSLAVDVGQTVTQGQVIAYCGSTGNSTGPHCHFEVRLNGDAVDPNDYVN